MSVGGNRSPYRPPCGYSADDPERYWLGGPWQHYNPAAADLPLYQNTTTVPNYEAGPATIPPYTQPIVGGACGGVGQPACGPWADPPPANTYGPFSPAQTATLAACRKVGFKTVFARKYWQGRFGFGDPDQCAGCGIGVGLASQRKYRTVSWMVSVVNDDGGGETVTFLSSGNCTVDRFSGKISGAISQSVANTSQFYDPPDFNTCINMSNAAEGTMADVTAAFTTNLCGGVWTGGLADLLNTGSTETVTITTATCSGTQMTLAYTETEGTETITTNISITLSDPYDTTDVDDDVEALLAFWNLADDVQYPWRTDSACTAGPYLSYDETTGNTPNGLILDGPGCPDDGPVTNVTVDWDDSHLATGTWTFNWNPTVINGYAASSCAFTGSFTENETNTGAALGKPLTTLFGAGVVYCPYFDFLAEVYSVGDCDGGGSGLTLVGYGAWGGLGPASDIGPGPTYNASQWTNALDAATLLPGAFAAFGSHSGGGGLQITAEVCGDAGGTYMPGFLIKSKYAEVILLTAPSHDFDRPCGPKDAETVDQTTVDYCFGADSPCTLGTLRSATDWSGLPGTCPNDGWNDNHPKGDWLLFTWTTDFRAVAGGAVTPAATQECSAFMPCCPAVVYFSNGGETSDNSQIFGVPPLALDNCFGNLWVMCPMQWMTDPLWQVPVMSETCYNARGPAVPGVWAEDDGSGHSDGTPADYYYYPQRPWEEARLTVPSGAPALPGDAALPVASSISPPTGGNCFMPIWVWALNRAANIAAAGRFSCDYADPFAICSDNTELQL